MPRRELTGSRLRQLRIDRGLKQAELARACGISPSYLNLIEHNRRRIAGGLLRKLAAKLSVDPAVLSDGAEEALTATLEMAHEHIDRTGASVEAAEDFAARFPMA